MTTVVDTVCAPLDCPTSAGSDEFGHEQSTGTPESLGTFSYGGKYTWSDMPYRMHVEKGFSLLGWLNGFTQKLLVLDDIVLATDGTFTRPSDGAPLFPRGGFDLRWRWDQQAERIVIDFWSEGRRLPWRWDELRPRGMRFPSTAPDLEGHGHAGKFSFRYRLLSRAASPTFEGSLSQGGSHTGLLEDVHSPGEPGQLHVPLSEDDRQELLEALEPVSKEGDSFAWWRSQLAEATKKHGAEIGMGSAFQQPPMEAALGAGSFGLVWRARDTRTGRLFAAKNLRIRRRASTMEAIAQNEFQIAAKMQLQPHAYIVSLFLVQSFALGKEWLYMLLMEYCPYGDLQQLLDDSLKGPSSYEPPPEALLWIGQIFLAVEHVHVKMELLLRDLKPGNVVISAERHAKLTDFGFGRMLADSPGGQWTFDVPPSTPGYAAPELISRDPYSYPADLYSFGTMVWVLLSGGVFTMDVPAPPTKGRGNDYASYEDDWELLHEALRQPAKSRRPVDDEALEVIRAMTQRDPDERPELHELRETPFFRDRCPALSDAAPMRGASRTAVAL